MWRSGDSIKARDSLIAMFDEIRASVLDDKTQLHADKVAVQSLQLYYTVKVILVVRREQHDYSFVTGDLHECIEKLMEKIKAPMRQNKDAALFESFMRLLRARFIIEHAVMRHGFIRRVFDALQDAAGVDKVATAKDVDFVAKGPYPVSVEVLKHYCAILCQNYSSVDMVSLQELDLYQSRQLWKLADKLASRHASDLGYNRIKDRIKLEGLTSLSVLRADQIDEQR